MVSQSKKCILAAVKKTKPATASIASKHIATIAALLQCLPLLSMCVLPIQAVRNEPGTSATLRTQL
jgi:hypothetical protein